MEKKKNDFIAQGSILAIASILVRVMGMIYRIPMTAIIGDKGNGFYSYAYSVYTILLLLSSYSLPLAVSKMVSAKAQLGQWRNVKRVFICAIAFAIGIGTTFGLIVLIGAQFFTRVFFHSELAAIALRFMAPTILIMALLGVFRGFFQGLQNTLPTAVSQIVEGLINAIMSVVFAYFLFDFGHGMDVAGGTTDLGYAWGAAGGAIGTGAGALAGLIFCFILFVAYRKILAVNISRDKTGTQQEYGAIIANGAKLLYAYGEATVPKVTVTLRKSYGGAHIVMSCKQIRGDINYAWPSANIAVMGADGAVQILYGKELKAVEDPEEKAKLAEEKKTEYNDLFCNPYQAAQMGYIDDIIEPRNTRFRVIRALEQLAGKKQTIPAKKHDNLPL